MIAAHAPERLLPQNIDAEYGVLGSIVLNAEALSLVADSLAPDDFYRDAHRTIYAAMLHLYRRQEPADFLTLCDLLEREGHLQEVGGASFITGLLNYVPTSGNIEYYAKMVTSQAVRRRLIAAAGVIAATAYEEEDAEQAIEQAEAAIYGIQQGTVSRDLESLDTVLLDFSRDLDRTHTEYGQLVGIQTSFDSLDSLLGGLQPGELVILGGRPGEGKTSLILNILLNVLFTSRRRCAFFSLEMSKIEVARRLVSMDAGIDSQKLRNRALSPEEWERFSESMARLSGLPVFIDESGDLSIAALRSKCRRHKAKHGLDLVLVDYIQLMSASGMEDTKGRRQETRVQELGRISRDLKQLAKELQVSIICCASLNRAVEARADQTPKLSDLRESGSIESDADIVMFIRRSRETPGISLINVEKHRNGPVGEVRLHFDAALTKFDDVATGEEAYRE